MSQGNTENCSQFCNHRAPKISSLLGERQALTLNKKTFASHLPDRFCYSLGVYEDRKQIVNIPFKLFIAF